MLIKISIMQIYLYFAGGGELFFFDATGRKTLLNNLYCYSDIRSFF